MPKIPKTLPAKSARPYPLDAWIPQSEVVAATAAVLTTFRDYGNRGNRQKTRMMWLIDEMGLEAGAYTHPPVSST